MAVAAVVTEEETGNLRQKKTFITNVYPSLSPWFIIQKVIGCAKRNSMHDVQQHVSQ